jgi:hypothetical protein
MVVFEIPGFAYAQLISFVGAPLPDSIAYLVGAFHTHLVGAENFVITGKQNPSS